MYEIFEQLLKKYGITAYKVSKETGISTATLSDWKNGKSIPKSDKMQVLAEYFNVPLDYLLGKNNLSEHFIANKLKTIRAERTIEDYSDRLGISSNLLKSFEEGKEIPSKGILDYIAEIEGIDPNYFFDDSSKIYDPISALKVSKIFSNEIENWLKTETCKEYVEFIYKAYKQGISKEMLKKADINIKIT